MSSDSFGSIGGVSAGGSGSGAVTSVAGRTGAVVIVAADLADFNMAVRTNRLDQMAAPSGSVSLNSQKITNLLDPASAQDAATKFYVDAAIQGLEPKPTARLATMAALAASTYANGTAGAGATLTANANGALSIDSVAVAVADVVLIKNQASAFQNGLYSVTATGSAGAVFVLTRHVDMDTAAKYAGAFIPVSNAGTTNANSLWLCNPSGAVTVGTTAIPFTQLNGATDLIQGTGIVISGNTISLANPSSSTLGGVQSVAAVTHQWVNSISTSGVPALSQPAAADLSDGVSGAGGAVMLTQGPTFAAGTTGRPSYNMASGTLKTTTAAGDKEYDGTLAYFSPTASTRGYVPSVLLSVYATATYSLANNTNAQPLFNVSTNGAINLPIGLHKFECLFSLTGLSASTATLAFGLAGGTGPATFTQAFIALGKNQASSGGVSNNANSSWQTGLAIIDVSAASAGTAAYLIKGIVRVTVAGTVVAQVQQGTNSAAAAVGAGSYIEFTPIGGTANATIGPWT